MPGLAKKKATKSYRGIETVDIINGTDRIKLTDHREKAVRLDGAVTDPRFGISLSQDRKTLHVVCFNGTISLPPHVAVKMKRGVTNIRRELFATYAPAIPYSDIIEQENHFSKMGAHRDVAPDEVIDCLVKIYGATGLPLFASYSDLNSPATLAGVNHDMLTTSFDAEHRFAPHLNAASRGRV
jgi:hypothetical protein